MDLKRIKSARCYMGYTRLSKLLFLYTFLCIFRINIKILALEKTTILTLFMRFRPLTFSYLFTLDRYAENEQPDESDPFDAY